MRTREPGVVGREVELESLRAFVAGSTAGPTAALIEGDAGVGKTTLWHAALAEAERSGARVLRSRPTESEASMSFSGLGDLLQDVLDEALSEIPGPQARALSRALLLEEGDAPFGHRALGVAFLSLLGAVSRSAPLLVAVDDIQWLDAPSGAVLAYAARRLREEPVGVLLARRRGLPSNIPEDLERSLAPWLFRRVEVGAIGPDDLGRVLWQHMDAPLSRPLVDQIHDASDGNPFYALELARALERGDVRAEPGRPLPVPDSLHDLIAVRLAALPAASRMTVLAAAALSQPTTKLVEAMTETDSARGIGPAVAAGVLQLEGDRVRFTHPLLAAVAYEAGGHAELADLHGRLAGLIDEPEERARHLAAATDGPDQEVAAALEAAARHAEARGALQAAGQLLEQAHEATPPEDGADRVRIAIDAAYYHFESGDSRRAAAMLEDVIDGLEPGRERARALTRLARVRSYDEQAVGVRLFEQAISEAEGDRPVLAVAHEGLAACLFRLRERLGESVEHAALAADLAEELGEGVLAAEALSTRLASETVLGRESAAATLERALSMQAASAEYRVLGQPLMMAGLYWWWTDDLHRAHEAFAHLLEQTRVLGDESSRPYVLVLLGLVECALGELEAASARAAEGEELAEQAGQSALSAYNLALAGLADAAAGRADGARVKAAHALELVPETGGRPAEFVARTALGHVELAQGNPIGAEAVLGPIVSYAQIEQLGEPAAVPFVVDYIEALIELGRSRECLPFLDWYEANATRLQRHSALGASARCRGLIAAAAKEDEVALFEFDRSLAEYAEIPFPVDRGRTLLALGAEHRRQKRKRAARDCLEEAVEVFVSVGAAAWAGKARVELGRISGRAPTLGALTPSEERVAALVAGGKTNREVAAALFLSERTVEGHLTHIYGKLGVRSRTELSRAWREADD